jgi:hypothetical protein
MWIVKLALNRPYTFSVAAILILFLGFTSIATTFSHDRPYAARRCELDIYVHFNTQELATSMLACAVRISHLDPDITYVSGRSHTADSDTDGILAYHSSAGSKELDGCHMARTRSESSIPCN